MNLLVTGGAGFIGANFVRYWLDKHPGDNVVVLDLLTYAGDAARTSARRRPAVEGDIGDGDLVERLLEEHAHRRRRQLRRRVAQQPTPSSTPAASSGRTCSARRRCSRRRGATASSASTTSRPVRSTATSALDARTPSPRSRRIGRARRTTRRRRRPTMPSARTRDVRPPGHDHELLEQLRAAPVPGEGHPALPHQCAGRPPAAALLVHAEPPRVAARGRPLPRDRVVLERGRVGETYNVGSGRRGLDRGDRRPHPRPTGKPQELKTIVPDRPGHDRRYLLDSSKLRSELGWAPAGGVRGGTGRDGGVVRGQP